METLPNSSDLETPLQTLQQIGELVEEAILESSLGGSFLECMEPLESSTLQTLQMTLFLARTKDNIPGGSDGLEGLEGLEDLEGLEGIELDGGVCGKWRESMQNM